MHICLYIMFIIYMSFILVLRCISYIGFFILTVFYAIPFGKYCFAFKSEIKTKKDLLYLDVICTIYEYYISSI